jgi:heme-degrading monooxygenase HmoA
VIAVLFELEPREGADARYFDLAAGLAPALAHVDGFVSVERFASLARPGRYLSLSFWRDEAAVAAWRAQAGHRLAQQEARDHVLAHYRLRVAQVLRDYGREDRDDAPADSRAALR